jgi:outer membrane protein insertion porin family
MKKVILSILLSLMLASAGAWAASSFRYNEVEFQGLQRISPSTIYHYLHLKNGQSLDYGQTGKYIRTLYKTGFFEHIELARRGNILIIKVKERPIIGYLKISGNNAISGERLDSVMKTVDIVEGRIYNPAMLERIRQSLLNQYYQLGYYNARVEVDISTLSNNRVSIKINISEGLVAKIHGVHIIGNHAFSERQLQKQLTISMPNLFTFLTQEDRYSEERLEESLEKLRAFYLDHGYLKFAIKSAQAEITPDRKSIYVVITVEEGQPFYVTGYDLTGRLLLPRSELEKKITIKPGDTFSRQEILDSEKAITDAFGSEGYLFINVTVEPKVDEAKREVFLHFNIQPGKRVYVHHVSFSDNHRTNDEALRREVVQFESAVASTTKLEETKHRLSLLAFMKTVEMSVKPVPNTDNQVDVNYKVTEDNSAQASVTASYSLTDRLGFGVGLTQKNFFGTGNTLGINFNQNRYEKYYSLAYSDPYYTLDGISRDVNVYASRVNPAGANLAKAYTSNDFGASVTYGIPIGQEKGVLSRVYFGFGYENTLIHLTAQPTAQVTDFTTVHGRHYQQLHIHTGVTRDSRDKAIFPTLGGIQKLFAEIYAPAATGSLKYYQFNYEGKWYHPFTHGFIGTARALLGYANSFEGISHYPFFKNYYAGGFESVHGYEGNTLGPRDSNDNPFGGNLLTVGGFGLVIPNFVSDSVRTLAFLDAGNVYTGNNNRKYGGQSTGSGPLRYSTGLEVDWLAPMGFAIGFSYAKPLNRQPGDKDQRFQFSLGANLG